MPRAAGSRLTIRPPRDYLLRRDLCSYGYFLLEPNHWDPATRQFRRVLDTGRRSVSVSIEQPSGVRGGTLVVRAAGTLSEPERAAVRRDVARMLNLHEPAETIAEFHRLDPRWRRAGRGRLFRSPTLFEDVIKTVTSCNVAWPSTINMNRRLCEVVGRDGAFPTAERLADCRPQLLRARCGVGYRDARIVELARMFADGRIVPEAIEDPALPDDRLREILIEWPGIGPYAAANIMQLLGRYAHLPLDTESVRHGRTVLGFRGGSRAVMRRIERHFAPFAHHKFRSYWFELWGFYERRRGKSWTWEKRTTGSTFTASQLK